jgi:endonuclease YncB( thermonuclease family)
MDNLKIIKTNPQPLINTKSIESLVSTIRLELQKGKKRALLAIEQEKKVTYWNIGKHIKEHLLDHSDRAEYGKDLLTLLANELNIGKTTLYRSLKFYESYPQILQAPVKLTWTHYSTLLSISDQETREKYEQKILKENLSSRELKKIIKNDKEINPTPTSPPITQLSITRDKPFIYKLKEIQQKTVIDLGFQFFIESPFEGLTKDAIIQVTKKGNTYTSKTLAKAKAPHYTYKAYFLEAIDGDTIWANIDLGFNTWTKQKLRLKGINAQSIETTTGLEAQEFIMQELKDCQFIAVKTYWRDKFTRYLVDIFYDKNERDFYKLVEDGEFLNQGLLNVGLAVGYE